MIKMIWAQDLNGGIGFKNKLPWNLPQELRFFKTTTLGKVVVMGYNTFLSMNFKPLSERINVVLTSKKDIIKKNPEITYCKSVDEVMKKFARQEIFIIGGKQTYQSFYDYADELIVSRIEQIFECDAYMKIDLWQFQIVQVIKKDGFNVEIYHRKE